MCLPGKEKHHHAQMKSIKPGKCLTSMCDDSFYWCLVFLFQCLLFSHFKWVSLAKGKLNKYKRIHFLDLDGIFIELYYILSWIIILGNHQFLILLNNWINLKMVFKLYPIVLFKNLIKELHWYIVLFDPSK